MATARGQGFKQLTPQMQIPTWSAHQTFRIKNHGSSSHSAVHIHTEESTSSKKQWKTCIYQHRRCRSVVDLPSLNLVQNRQYRDAVTCLPAHTEQKIVTIAKVRTICTRSGIIVILLPPTHQQGSRNNQGHQMNQRCTIMTKLVLRSEPHACAQTATQQRMIVR